MLPFLPPVMHPQPHLLNYEEGLIMRGTLTAKAHSSTMRAWAYALIDIVELWAFAMREPLIMRLIVQQV